MVEVYQSDLESEQITEPWLSAIVLDAWQSV